MKALQLTGNTYPRRLAIRALGGHFNYEAKAWHVPLAQEAACNTLADNHGLDVETVDVPDTTFDELTTEELRVLRQRKVDRKVAQKRERAARLTTEAEALRGEQPTDYALITQPVLVGHHSQRSHEKMRERWRRNMDKEFTLRHEAKKLEQRADSMEKHAASVKGDAEARRVREREELDKVIKVGDVVHSWIYGNCTVHKVNKKTYTVTVGHSGSLLRQDKTLFEPIKRKEF